MKKSEITVHEQDVKRTVLTDLRTGEPASILKRAKENSRAPVYTQNEGITEAADIRIAQKLQARKEELSEFDDGFRKYSDYTEK